MRGRLLQLELQDKEGNMEKLDPEEEDSLVCLKDGGFSPPGPKIPPGWGEK